MFDFNVRVSLLFETLCECVKPDLLDIIDKKKTELPQNSQIQLRVDCELLLANLDGYDNMMVICGVTPCIINKFIILKLQQHSAMSGVVGSA